VYGVGYASIGIDAGRIVTIGRAGNPDTMDGVDVVVDGATAVVEARNAIVTPGGVDPPHSSPLPQVIPAALAGGATTLMIQDVGLIWSMGAKTPSPGFGHLGRARGSAGQRCAPHPGIVCPP
jgi:urease subunit alpha